MRICVLGPGEGSLAGADLRHAEAVFIRVGADLAQLERACEAVGRALGAHWGAPLVAVRATVPPGTMRGTVIPALEKHSGRRAGEEFGVCYGPERLRDVRALVQARGLELPILDAIAHSRRAHLDRGVRAVLATGKRKVGLLGVCESPGSEALRDNPMLELAERLMAAGCTLRLYDPCLDPARVPRLAPMLAASVEEVMAYAGTVVISVAAHEFAGVPARVREGQTILDFARACDARTVRGVYEGLCW